MKKTTFPLIAAGIGILLALVLVRFGAGSDDEEFLLPPLTLLFMSEFGFLLTAAGAWFGARVWFAQRDQRGTLLAALGCLALALAFLYVGLVLWRGVAPA